MRTAAAKPTQQYLALWRECKERGSLPAPPDEKAADVITEHTTITQILERMAKIGEFLT